MGLFKRSKNLWQAAEDNAEELYHEILKRADDPEPDDAAKIEQLLPYLGITWKQAKADFAVLKRAAELTATIAKADESEKVVADVTPKLQSLQKQLDDYKAKMEPQIAILANEQYRHQQIVSQKWPAKSELSDLHDRFPRAFGVRKADIVPKVAEADEPNPRLTYDKKPEVVARYGGPPTTH